MSLQVWLPLTNGTLKQQGLKNISATIGGTVGLTDAGKLGKCATIGTAAGGITLPASAMTSFTECSVAFWINITSWNTGWDTIFQAGLGSTPWNNYIFGILRNQGNYLCFTVSNGSSTSSGSYASSNLTAGQWMHLAFTYGSSKCKIYINGVLDKEYSTSITPNFAGITHIAIGRSTNGSHYQCKCKLNDFRIYDHCLSPMEVKELAKGLILHYPLNRQGWGQENLMPGTYRADGNNTNKIYGWMNNGYGTPEIIMKDGNKCIHLQANCSNTTTPSIVSASKLLLENGVEYTVSCDLMYDKEIQVGYSTPIHYHNGSTNSTDPFNMTNVNNGKGFSWKSIKPVAGTIIPANTWQHYEMRLTALATPSDSSLPYSTYRAFIYGSVRTVSETTIVNMWLKNWKIEKGSIATPWCPNSSDALATTMGLNSTTEYDCSGFCNNGTRTGTFSWTSDTPKYSVSTEFNNSNYINIGTQLYGVKDEVTVNLWVYKSNWSVASGTPFSCVEGGGYGWQVNGTNLQVLCGTGTTSNSYWSVTLTTNNLSAGWHMFTLTYNGMVCKAYIDAIEKNSTTKYTTKTPIYYNNNSAMFIGGESSGSLTAPGSGLWTGKISDVRIYATALSASDVKSLYQNSAYIDSSGNVYGAVHSEV